MMHISASNSGRRVRGAPPKVLAGSAWKVWLWSAPALVLIVFAVVVPVMALASGVVDASAIRETLTRTSTLEALRFSLWQALWSTTATLVIGGAMAWILARYEFRGRRFAAMTLTVPFVLPTVVVASAYLAILPGSVERSFVSIILAHVFFNMSVIIRLVGPVWSVIDPDLLAAARSLGASPTRVIARLLLPMARPALLAAGSLVFVMCFTSYGVVRILGGPGLYTVEVEIYRRAVLFGDVSGASALAIAQTLVIVAVAAVLARRPTRQLHRLRSERRSAPRWAVAIVACASLFIIAPLVSMFMRSFFVDGRLTITGWRQLISPTGSLLSNIDLPGVLGRSLIFALIAAAIAVPIGIATAFGLARRSGAGTRALLIVPVAASPVVVGLGILVAYDTHPFDLRAAWWLIPVIHAVVALPFVVRAALPVTQSIPRGLRDAAAVLGATPARRWLSIDAPLLRPAAATGLGLSMALSLGEFGATSFLTRRDTTTLPIVIDQLLGRAGESAFTTAMAASSCLMLLTGLVVLVFDSSLRA